MVNSLSSTDLNTQIASIEKKIGTYVNSHQNVDNVPKVIPDDIGKVPLAAETVEQQKLPAEKVQKITDSLNKLLETTSTELRYQYHEKLDKYYVTLVNSRTNEIVREIPNKKLMDIYAAMLDLVGVFVDKKI